MPWPTPRPVVTFFGAELSERQDEPMRDLMVTGTDGTDLQLVDEEGGHYRLLVDDRVRDAVDTISSTELDEDSQVDDDGAVEVHAADADESAGHVTEHAATPILTSVAAPPETPGAADVPSLPPGELVTPRTVQELLRAGHSAQQVATAAGWELSKVERYAAPIESERSYIAGLARDLSVGNTTSGAAATVGQRVAARLHDRGVLADTVGWDARRTAGSGWIVVCRFSAGGRSREASWQFRPTTRTLAAIDDEARWLGEDERAQSGRSAAPKPAVKVFDVEAEGGVTETVDMVAAMQARSRDRRARSARNTRVGRMPPVADTSGDETGIDESVADRPTVDDLGHDPVTGTVDLFTETKLSPDDATATGGADTERSENGAAADVVELAESAAADAPASPSDAEVDTPAADPQSDLETGDEAEQELHDDENAATASAEGGADQVTNDETPAVEPARAPKDLPTPPRRPSSARPGRPSVPSWDDIMFGGRRGRD